MICSTCYGKRFFFYLGKLLPCPECEASGELYCCEGLQEQPESRIDDQEDVVIPSAKAS